VSEGRLLVTARPLQCGELLKRYRLAAHRTKEELAERAMLSSKESVAASGESVACHAESGRGASSEKRPYS